MIDFPPALDHGEITLAFENIYYVTGTNQTSYEGQVIQHSRNMLIIKQGEALTLINTVRLNEASLDELDKLGTVQHVMRIGAFHGKDDAYYLDRYQAKFWALDDTTLAEGLKIDHVLSTDASLPIADAKLIPLAKQQPKEVAVWLPHADGILVTCDSIKNWTKIDPYFSAETAEQVLAAGEIQSARISPIWLQATQTQKTDLSVLLEYKFKHLISAHGEVLRDTAYDRVKQSITQL